jgi:hypothetical protein
VLAVKLETLSDDIAQDQPVIRDAYYYAIYCEREFFAASLRDNLWVGLI